MERGKTFGFQTYCFIVFYKLGFIFHSVEGLSVGL